MAQSKPRAKPSVGIDLGTTYSCVAVFQNGRPEVIANNQGNRITPSVVAFTKEGRLIGEGAEIQRKLDPTNAIYNSKRFIGRTFEDPAVQASYSSYPFNVLEKNKKIQFQVKNGPKTLNLTPEEIAAAILSKMKKIAEDYLEETVEDAVITVPAYFTDSQRQATVNAGKIAGLNVSRIINEPTAAAMAYGLREGTKENEGKHILVYDLGGGTFDVSVLEIEEDLIQVQATAGNSNLGGEDFNDIIVEHFKQEIFSQFKVDLTSNHKAIRRLTSACEKLKRNLSAENVTKSKLELDNFLPDGKDFVSTLTRAKFENLCKARFDETLACVQKAIQDAELTKEDIDEIVLVGGSSRIPKLQSMLSSFFNYKILNKSINPDEAVACGAAVQAAIINNDPHFTVKDMLLVDVIPLSIGVNVFGGINKIVLERNTPIPVRRIQKGFATTVNNQTGVTFKIIEGERTMTKDNKILGSFNMNGLPPRKATEVKFDLEYEIDENGILSVSATVRETGMKAGITLDPRSSGKLSDEEVKRLVKEAETMKHTDQNEENRVLAMNKLTSLCTHISFVAQDFPVTEVDDILKSIEDCRAWVRDHPDVEESQFASKYNELTEKASHVLSTSRMAESTSKSSHVHRIGLQKAKFCLKEGRDLLLSSNVKDKIKAGEYFFKAYKIELEGGKLFNAIEALVLCGHTHRSLIVSVTDFNLKWDLAMFTVRSLTIVLDLEQNKTLSDEERKAVIDDIQFGTQEVFKIISNLEDKDKFDALNNCMRALNNKNAKKNMIFCQIVFQSRVKEIKLILDKVNANLSMKEAQKFIQMLNYPKEEAKLLAKSFEEKQEIAKLNEVIHVSTLHVEGLNQINCAGVLLEGAEVDHPDTIDKALMALDHLSEAKQLTQEAHPKVFVKANFFEGKIFMDYILNPSKAKSCFENVVTASELNHFNTEEYRESKYILEDLESKQLREQGKTPTVDRESLVGELREDLEKIKQADSDMSDENFVDFLLTEYPPKHKDNYKKPVITSSGSKKKAYIRLTTFYHPDKVDASKHGERYKVLCGEISKYVNGRFLKM